MELLIYTNFLRVEPASTFVLTNMNVINITVAWFYLYTQEILRQKNEKRGQNDNFHLLWTWSRPSFKNGIFAIMIFNA